MRVEGKRFKKPLIIALLAIAMLVAGVLLYLVISSKDKVAPGVDVTEKTQAVKEEVENLDKGQPSAEEKQPEHEKEKDITPGYEGDSANSSQSITGVISHKSVSGPNLVIRTTINQVLGSGTCTLKLTSAQTTVTRTVGIAQNPSSASCEGFDIPTSELAPGNWDIEVTVTSGDRSGTLRDGVVI